MINSTNEVQGNVTIESLIITDPSNIQVSDVP